MAIGTQQSAGTLNGLLVRRVQEMNIWAANVAELQAYVVQQGADGLTSLDQPFTSPDAASFAAAVSYLNTIALVWIGQASQPATYNFQNQLAELVGPTPS